MTARASTRASTRLDREIQEALDDSTDPDRESMAAAFLAGKRERDAHREAYERRQREADASRASGDLEAAERHAREAGRHLARSTYGGVAPKRGLNAAVDQIHYARPRRAGPRTAAPAQEREETPRAPDLSLTEAQKESLREDLARWGSVTCPRCGWNGLRVTKDGKIRRHGRAQTGRSRLSCGGSGLSIL